MRYEADPGPEKSRFENGFFLKKILTRCPISQTPILI